MRNLLATILGFIGRLISPVFFFLAGKSHEQKKNLERENEILQKQRDNNVNSPDHAYRLWQDWHAANDDPADGGSKRK